MTVEDTELDQVRFLGLSTPFHCRVHLIFKFSSLLESITSPPSRMNYSITSLTMPTNHLHPELPFRNAFYPSSKQQLYHKVSVSVISLPPFLDTVSHSPRLGRMVKTWSLPETGNRRLAELLPLVLNIVDLDMPCFPPLEPLQSIVASHSVLLPLLRRISVSFDVRNIDNLSLFANFPSLRKLRIYDWDETQASLIQRSKTTAIPQVTTLLIEGVAADTETVTFLVDALPGLLHLELYTSYTGYPTFGLSLPYLPTTLRTLRLLSVSRSRAATIDHFLPRFSQLRSIRLGSNSHSSTIHSVLLQLPLLAHIQLGFGPLDLAGFLSLVTGPTRLLSLRTVTLDFYVYSEGERCQRPSETVRGIDEEVDGFDIEMSDWEFPAEWNGAPLNVGDYEELKRLAKENGILLNGTIKEAIDWCRNYRLELNNRAVLNAYNRQDFTRLRRIRSYAAQTGGVLPNIDFDSLDVNRLEIIEMDLPERDWWVLSLMNRGRLG